MNDFCITRIENHWKELTTSANTLFNDKKYNQALNTYTKALYKAEILNTQFGECTRLKIPTIQIFIISCNNLANTYLKLELLQDAEKMLKRSIFYLLHLVENERIDKDEVQAELKRASMNYIHFVEETKAGSLKHAQLLNTLKEKLLETDLIK